MLASHKILLLTGVVVLMAPFQTVKAAVEGVVSFPYKMNPCTGKGSLGAVCCQGIRVRPIDFNKTLCVEFQILSPKADVKVSMDDNVVAEFVVDATNPPTYCIPIILPVDVAMCLKLHDIKRIGLLDLQICATALVNYRTNQVFIHKMPCVKLGPTGIGLMKQL